jgi:alpha-mannosidase
LLKEHFVKLPGKFVGLLCYAVLLVDLHGVTAQSAPAEPYRFSPRGRSVLERLGAIEIIPATHWQYHLGDIENGERTDLNSNGWQTAELPFQAPDKPIWLRSWLTVPQNLDGYDLSGARVWFKLSLASQGPGPEYAYQVVYFNGIRIAEGQHLERQLLFESAKPGQKVLIAVKLLATQLGKSINGAELTIDPTAARPDPDDLRTELLSAAEILPAITKDQTELGTQEEVLESTVEAIDIAALDTNNQAAFDASLLKAQANLEPLRPTLKHYLIHMTGNAHIDAAWLWTWTETVDQVHFTFANALRLMNEYPDYAFAQSASQYSDWMETKFPGTFHDIQERVKEGRWELVGGMWIEPDLNMPDGESEVRQLLVGMATLNKLYGRGVRIGWNPDSFGYNWQLPQVYKKSGIDYFVTQKLAANETNPLPFKLFWWQSPDGSKVLSYFPHTYSNGDLDPARLSNDLVKARTLSPGLAKIMDLYGVGDHGGGPTRTILDQGMHWMADGKVVPRMRFETALGFFTSVETRISHDSPTWNYKLMAQGAAVLANPPAGEISIPTWRDELYFEHHRGTYTTQAQQKRNMRESEEWLLNAEKYSSLGWLYSRPYPGVELTEAWKKALFNDFHDVAAGSSLGIIYKDAQRDYDQVRWATEEASSQALEAIDARIDTRGTGVPILVWNPLGWSRSGVASVEVQMPQASESGISVIDAQGKPVVLQVLAKDNATGTYTLLVESLSVPSMGYTVLHAVAGERAFASDLRASGMTLENTFLKVTVDPRSGCITSLYDKKAQFETLAAAGCGNQLQAFQDIPRTDDAWNIDPGTLDHFTPLTLADSVQLIETGPLRAVIRVSRQWQSSKFVQDITLYANSDHVEVANDIDWHETHVLLKAAFPLAASSNKATYEIPYGTIERPTTRNNSWEQAKFEVPALRWADLGDDKHGFSLINESKYGYDCRGNVLRLSLLRSAIWPDPNADKGRHQFSYALYPHGGDWKAALTVRHGYEYNYKLQAMQVESHGGRLPASHSFVQVEPENLVLTALKKAEDGDGLILRFYEWAGKKTDAQIEVPAGATSATSTNLMEKPEGPALQITESNRISVPVTPYSINTIRIDYGAVTARSMN